MLEKLNHQDFEELYHLMERSFPSDEYRPYEAQKELLDHPRYSIYVLYGESRSITAFMALWNFENFVFLEHFAVNPASRNGGIGGKMLKELVALSDKMICLEVEPPETELALRRIKFYQRNHFFLNEYPYMQPPISKGKHAIPLFLMTSANKISEQMFQELKAALYTEVYKCGTNQL